MDVVGIVGSLRRGSRNRALLDTAAERAPAPMRIRVQEIGDLPHLDTDLEAAGVPEPVAEIRRSVAAADGLLIATPEYNWSVPGVLKNAIDWLSRGPDSPIDDLPVAFLSGAGGSGGRRAQAHLRDIVAHNRMPVAATALQIPRVGEHVVDGRLATAAHLESLDRVLTDLAALIDHA